jgi:hypothetical protein
VKYTKKDREQMARNTTGRSNKTNRQNLEALALAQTWGRQFGIGVKMSPQFAWVFTNGKQGIKPDTYGQTGESKPATHTAPTYDTFKIALQIIKARHN